MDFLNIAPFNIPSPTVSDHFFSADAAINPYNEPQPKRLVGRPKGSKNKPILQRIKRPVGRPKGSKNKRKTTTAPSDSETENVIEIPTGADIMQQLLEYCCQFHASITVLNACGELSNIVPYYQPYLSMPGPFTIWSFSYTLLPPPTQQHLSSGTITSEETSFPFVVSLSSPNGGNVCGGMVGKSARATSKVELVVKITTINTSGVSFDNICNGQANNNNGNEEVMPVVASLLKPQDLKDLTFREFYNYCNPDNPLENLLTMKMNNTLFDDDDDDDDDDEEI